LDLISITECFTQFDLDLIKNAIIGRRLEIRPGQMLMGTRFYYAVGE